MKQKHILSAHVRSTSSDKTTTDERWANGRGISSLKADKAEVCSDGTLEVAVTITNILMTTNCFIVIF